MDNKEKIINPHDKFFKEFFSKEQEARGFLSLYLPEDIKKIIDLSTLSIYKDSFIEKELQESFSDMLYSDKGGRYPQGVSSVAQIYLPRRLQGAIL